MKNLPWIKASNDGRNAVYALLGARARVIGDEIKEELERAELLKTHMEHNPALEREKMDGFKTNYRRCVMSAEALEKNKKAISGAIAALRRAAGGSPDDYEDFATEQADLKSVVAMKKNQKRRWFVVRCNGVKSLEDALNEASARGRSIYSLRSDDESDRHIVVSFTTRNPPL